MKQSWLIFTNQDQGIHHIPVRLAPSVSQLHCTFTLLNDQYLSLMRIRTPAAPYVPQHQDYDA